MENPEFLGPYRIGEKLGRGGMGTVFDAVHEKTGEQVAVKLIAEHVADEMRFRRRFDAEIETLKRLRHDNIVRLIGYGEEHGQLFYSMELIKGEALQERIKREKKLPWMTVLDISIQVCSALKHAHDIGVIHRDLKPANLVLDGGDQVKVVDFGIAKIFGHEQTAEGSVMGTADYMAPEQATGKGITSRTDLYALGCVMYAMLCGRPPFRGKNITEVIEKLKTKDPAPLELIDPDLPEDIVQIVHELLDKKPTNRPPTALAVSNRLNAMRAGLHKMMTLTSRDADMGTKGPEGDVGTDSGHPVTPDDSNTNNQSSNTNNQGTRVRAGGTAARGNTAAGGQSAGKNASRGTHVEPPDQTVIAQVNPSAGTVHAAGALPADKTLVSDGVNTNETSAPPATNDTSSRTSGGTHFQTVAESGDEGAGFFTSSGTSKENKLSNLISIAALAIGVVLAIGAVTYTIRKPSAHELLAEIDAAIATDQLDNEQDTVEKFLKIYQDHPRYKEVEGYRLAYERDRAIRQIRRRVDKESTPQFEKRFLDAMDLRRSYPITARDELDDWIAVFVDADEKDDTQLSRLAEITRFEIKRLERENPVPKNEARLDELLERVASTAELSKAEAIRRLEGIKRFYADKTWAAPAVAAATTRLDEVADK